jgi:short-subunit dehydrogenase
MTAVNEFPMPWLISADKAAAKIVRALARKKKVFNFPWQTSLLMRLTRWVPDWIMARSLKGYTGDRAKPPE